MDNELQNEVTTVTDPLEPTIEPQETPEQRIPYDRFKQKVDEANELKRKLAEFETAQAETQRKQLEAQNEFKTLYEQAQAEIATIKQIAVATKKDALLTKAGYSEDQIAVLRATVSGETDEEIARAVEVLAAVIAPKQNYIHQTPMGGGDTKPPVKEPASLGTTLYERVMNKNKK